MKLYEVDLERRASTVKTFRVFAVSKGEALEKAYAKADRSFWDKDRNAEFVTRNISADA